MDWHHSWTSCKWRGSNKEVVAGEMTPVGLLQLTARQPLSACRFPAKHSKHRIAVPNKDKMHLLSWPAHPGQCAGYVKLYNVMTWRMLGGESAAGPLHPNLTACMHAHPALYLQPLCRTPDHRQACLDMASELMDPSTLLPAALPSTGTWGFCHPSFSPTCQPARCRYFRGFAALWLWLSYHMRNFRKGSAALKGFTTLLLLLFDGVLPWKVLASLLPVLVPTGLKRCPSPKTPGDCHPGEGTEAHIAPPINMA